MDQDARVNGVKKLEVEFDLTNFTVRDLRDLSTVQRSGDIDAQLAIYAKVVTKCSLGDLNDPETILDLNYKAMRQISDALNEAMKADAKK